MQIETLRLHGPDFSPIQALLGPGELNNAVYHARGPEGAGQKGRTGLVRVSKAMKHAPKVKLAVAIVVTGTGAKDAGFHVALAVAGT